MNHSAVHPKHIYINYFSIKKKETVTNFSESLASFSDLTPGTPRSLTCTHTFPSNTPAASSLTPTAHAEGAGGLPQLEMRIYRQGAGSPCPAASKLPGVSGEFRFHVPEKSAHAFSGPAAPGSTFGSSEQPSSQL